MIQYQILLSIVIKYNDVLLKRDIFIMIHQILSDSKMVCYMNRMNRVSGGKREILTPKYSKVAVRGALIWHVKDQKIEESEADVCHIEVSSSCL